MSQGKAKLDMSDRSDILYCQALGVVLRLHMDLTGLVQTAGIGV